MKFKHLLLLILSPILLWSCQDIVTPEPEPIDIGQLSLSISDVTQDAAIVTVQCTNNKMFYVAGVISQSEYEAYGSANEMYNAMLLDIVTSNNLGTSRHSGSKMIAYSDLTAQTKYYAYAFGIEEDGSMIASATAIMDFTTTDIPEPTELLFTFETLSTDITTIEYRITPNIEDMDYVTLLLQREVFEGTAENQYGGDADLALQMYVAYLTQSGAIRYSSIFGEITREYIDLDADTEYILFAVGVSELGVITSQVAMHEVAATLPAVKVDMTFEFTPTFISTTKIECKVTPSSNEHTYYYGIFDVAYLAEQGVTEEDYSAVIEYNLAEFRHLATSNGVSVSEILPLVVVTGEALSQNTSLTPFRDYKIYAFGISMNGAPSTDIFVSETIRTASNVITDDTTFDITSSDFAGTDFTINVTPSKDDVRYYIGVVTETRYKDAYQSDLNMVADALILMENDYGLDWANNTSAIFTGPVSKRAFEDLKYSVSFTDNNVVVVFGVNGVGDRTTEVGHLIVEPPKIETSDNVITLEITSIESHSAYYTTTTTNSDSYIVTEIEAALYDSYTDDSQAVAWFKDFIGPYLSFAIKSGDASDFVTYLTPNTDYYLLAYGVTGEGNATTAITKLPFTTTADSAAPLRPTTHPRLKTPSDLIPQIARKGTTSRELKAVDMPYYSFK